MTKATVQFMRHVVRSSSLYPIGTLWLIACAVVPLGMAADTGPWPVIITLAAAAAVLILAASRRDDRREAAHLRADVEHVTEVVDAQREALEARIRVLTTTLIWHKIPVPPEEH